MRSGDIQLIVQPANYDVYGEKIDGGTTHGTWNPYDAHIPFLLMGWHVEPGETHERVWMTDIVPTVCAMIDIQIPTAASAVLLQPLLTAKTKGGEPAAHLGHADRAKHHAAVFVDKI